MMLQQEKADDYVICTGSTQTVEDFVRIAFNSVGLEDFSRYLVIDPKFCRPAEVDYLCGDSSKAQNVLGWKPKHSFNDLVKMMVMSDLK